MGSEIIHNDTLQITTEQGFPEILNLEKHRNNSIKLEDVPDTFSFKKPKARIYHVPPTRVFLVHNIEGKWLYWGKILIIEQTITEKETTGKFKIIEIYDPEYQEMITKHECPKGLGYFD